MNFLKFYLPMFFVCLLWAYAANAQVKVNLIDFPFGGDSLVADTQEELDERLLKLISHKKVRPLITWQRYEEGNAPKDCIIKRQTREIDGKFSYSECAITDAFKVVPDEGYADRIAAKEAEKLANKQAKEDLKAKVKDKTKKLTDDDIREALELLLEKE